MLITNVPTGFFYNFKLPILFYLGNIMFSKYKY